MDNFLFLSEKREEKREDNISYYYTISRQNQSKKRTELFRKMN